MDAETLTMLTGLLGTVLAFVLVGAALGGAWLLGRGWHRRDHVLGEPSVEELNSRKIAVLIARIDELAMELERSSEAQRFLAKTIAGATVDPVAPPNPMRAAERVVTPH